MFKSFVIIGVLFLTSTVHMPAAEAQTLTARPRAARFGVDDIRGVAYHPGPPLDGCSSTHAHQCPGPNKIPIYDSSISQDTLPFFQDRLQVWKAGKPDQLLAKYTIYYDSDFYNADFAALWGPSGRDDLGRYKKELNANFMHLYDWNPDPQFRNHGPFLKYASDLGMHVTIPVSNDIYQDICENRQPPWQPRVKQIFDFIYANGSPNPAAGMLKIFNEYNASKCRKAEAVAKVALYWKELEDARGVPDEQRLPIIFPVTYGIDHGLPGGSVLDVFNKFIDKDFSTKLGLEFWRARVIFATNPFNSGADMLKWINNDLPAWEVKNLIPTETPVMFTEYGRSSDDPPTKTEAEQAAWVKGQFESMFRPTKPANFLGASAFVNEYRFWLAGAEPDYALTDFGKGGGTWNKPAAMYIERVKYKNPNGGGAFWDASYEVSPQKPRLAYCEIGKVFLTQSLCP